MRFLKIATLTVYSLLVGCGHCPSEPLKSYAPQGDITLRLEQSGCGGATSGFVYEVRAYSADDQTGATLLKFDSDHRHDWDDQPTKVLDVRWLSPQRVQVRFHRAVRVFDERDSLGEISISYKYARGTNLMTGWLGESRIIE